MPAYRRILLKISGETLGGEAGFGFDQARAGEVASEILEAVREGVQVGLVVGGGNFFRGVNASQTGLGRVTVDQMGMLGTAINSLAVADLLRARGGGARVFSAIGMEPLIERFERRAAIATLEAGDVAVFAAGTGNPYFSTDTAAALRAVEIEAELTAKATKVDGVYDKDPKRSADAKRYEKISYSEVLEKGLGVMDAAAVALCRENKMPVLVFNLNDRGSILRVARGESIGTLMSD